MADPFQTDKNTLPEPHSTFASPARKDGVGKRAFAAIAKLWQPRGTTAEPAAATVSRYAMRLIDRLTGKAYSVDELPDVVGEALGVRPTRLYMKGNNMALEAFKSRLDHGDDAAGGFISDSTMRPNGALPSSFATALAALYPTHRVELRQAANNMQSITTTVVQAGPSGKRYRYFPASAAWGAIMPVSMARASVSGATHFCYEAEVAFDAAALNGSGWPATNVEIVGHGSGSTRSYLMINSSGLLYIVWQDSGGTAVGPAAASAAIPAQSAGVPVWFRAVARASNGSNCTIDYYYSTDQRASWTQVGVQRTGTISSFGAVSGSFWLATGGGGMTRDQYRIYNAQVRIGATLDPILPERIDLWFHQEGQGSNASLLGGSPTIYIDQAAQDGATLKANGFFNGSGAGTFQAEAYRCWTDHAPDFVQINTSHNDVNVRLAEWATQMDACVTIVNARYGTLKPPILHTTQNPEQADDSGELSLQHNRRQPDILQYAASKGRGCTDIYQAFVDANNSSLTLGAGDVHPSASGYAFWGKAFLDCFLGTSRTVSSDLP